MFALIKKYFFDKSGAFKLDILRSPIFISVLALKIISSFLFASNFLIGLFAKFVNYYVVSGFQNPYTFFYNLNFLDIFPYPKAMLWILSIPRVLFNPFLSADYNIVAPFHIFLYRLPILAADVVIFIILVRWLKNQQKNTLLFYWCSPILFYINYIHGQLDIIPIMFLFIFLYLLFKEKWSLSFIFLGLALASKLHIAILIPFILVYLLLKKRDFIQITLYFLISVLIFFLFNFNYLFTAGFIEIVLKTKEQLKIFDFQYRLSEELTIHFVPIAYLILFFKSLTYKTYNKDIFLMFLGFSFGILTLLIPPMPGWYYWILPFLIYFYIKQKDAPRFSFLALNLFYLFYFLFVRHSDFPEVFQFISPVFAASPNLYHFLGARGYNVDLLVNTVFSFLQASLALNVLWVYQKGINSNTKFKMYYKPYLIGLAGDSGSGKTTLANLIKDVFGEKNTVILQGDDMHKWERGHEMWRFLSHLNPKANELHNELKFALQMKRGGAIQRRRYDHNVGKFTLPRTLESKKIIIFEGLHSLFLNKMRNALDLKIFLETDEILRLHWKLIRDIKQRGYTKDQVLEQLQKREKDSRDYIQTQERYSDMTIYFRIKNNIADKVGDINVPLEIYLEFKCANDINVDPFLIALSDNTNVRSEHSFYENHQLIKVEGDVEPVTLDKIAYFLMPDLWDIIVGEPNWASGYKGLIQLFMCYWIFENMKTEEYER